MPQYRIVQVKPLTQQGAFNVQKLIKRIDVDRLTEKQIHLSSSLGTEPVDWLELNYGFPTKLVWVKQESSNAYADYGNFDSIYAANLYIENITERSRINKAREEELERWKATHGDFQVLKEYS